MSADEWPLWRKLEWQEAIRRELQANRDQVKRDVWLMAALARLEEIQGLAEQLDCIAHDLSSADAIGQCHAMLRDVALARDRLLGFHDL